MKLGSIAACVALLSLLIFSVTTAAPLRVAVVGGGVAGAASAYFIRQEFPDASITLFESSDRIGGRVKSFELEGRYYEAGAAVFTTFNYVIADLAKKLNISLSGGPSEDAEEASRQVLIWDGQIGRTRPWPLLQFSKETFLVGIAAQKFKLELLRNYLARIDGGKTPRTIQEFANAAGPTFAKFLTTSTAKYLQEVGIDSQEWIDSAVDPFSRVIYDQSSQLNGFSGFVTLVSADDTRSDSLGNEHLINTVLNASGAAVRLGSAITTLAFNPSKQSWDVLGDDYDAVILATPLERSGGIECVDLDTSETKVPRHSDQDPTGCGLGLLRPYISKWVTYVKVKSINSATFGGDLGDVDAIFTTPNSSAWFYSIAHKADLQSGETLYKVFSPQRLTEDQLGTMFTQPTVVMEQFWPAVFTKLDPLDFSKGAAIPSFVGRDGIFYPSAIESVTVALEGSTLSGQIVATLMAKQFKTSGGTETSAFASVIMRFLSVISAVPRWMHRVPLGLFLGCLLHYGGIASLKLSRSEHVLLYFCAILASLATSVGLDTAARSFGLTPAAVTRYPVPAAGWVMEEILAGTLSGIALCMLDTNSFLNAFLQTTLASKKQAFTFVSGLAVSWVMWYLVDLRSYLTAIVSVAAAMSPKELSGLWCDPSWYPSGFLTSEACSIIPPTSVLTALFASVVLYLAFATSWLRAGSVPISRWGAFALIGALAGFVRLDAYVDPEHVVSPWSPLLASGGISQLLHTSESIFDLVVLLFSLFFGAAICWLYTGRPIEAGTDVATKLAQKVSKPKKPFFRKFFAAFLLFISVAMGSSTLTFWASQTIIVLLYVVYRITRL